MSGASGGLEGRMNLEASSFNAASASQAKLKDAYLGVLKEEQQGDLRRREKERISESDESESCLQEEQQNPYLQNSRKSQSNERAIFEYFFAMSPHHIHCMNGRP